MTQVAETRSSVRPVHAESPPIKMSARLWGLRWPEWRIGGLDCVPASFSDALPFIAEHYPSMFASEPDRFLQETMTPAKRRFLEECDVYLFRDGERVVGLWMGHPSDWSSYYARSTALLPEYRACGVLGEALVRIADVLRDFGVERLECETSPTNIPTNRLGLSLGWIVTGTVNSERWGTLLRLTKYLTAASEECFRRQYVSATHIEPRSRDRNKATRSSP